MPSADKIIAFFIALFGLLTLPANYWWYLLPTIFAIILIIFSYLIGYKRSKRKFNYLKGRYEFIYVPLRQILIDIYPTTVRSSNYPSFVDRAERAWRILTKRHHYSILRRIKKSFLALFDKVINVRYGYEGGVFSLKEIRDVVTDNMKYADKELVNKIQRATRADYDSLTIGRDFDEELLKEEFELWDHILRNYEKLNKLFSSKN